MHGDMIERLNLIRCICVSGCSRYLSSFKDEVSSFVSVHFRKSRCWYRNDFVSSYVRIALSLHETFHAQVAWGFDSDNSYELTKTLGCVWGLRQLQARVHEIERVKQQKNESIYNRIDNVNTKHDARTWQRRYQGQWDIPKIDYKHVMPLSVLSGQQM